MCVYFFGYITRNMEYPACKIYLYVSPGCGVYMLVYIFIYIYLFLHTHLNIYHNKRIFWFRYKYIWLGDILFNCHKSGGKRHEHLCGLLKVLGLYGVGTWHSHMHHAKPSNLQLWARAVPGASLLKPCVAQVLLWSGFSEMLSYAKLRNGMTGQLPNMMEDGWKMMEDILLMLVLFHLDPWGDAGT